MKLLSGELVLINLEGQNKKDGFVLTTHRVRHTSSSSSALNIDSIMLEHVALCTLRKKSSPILLIFASIFGAIGLYFGLQNDSTARGQLNGPMIGAACAAVIFILAWIFSKGAVLFIRSGGGHIEFQVKGLKTEKIMSLIDRIEEAKNAKTIAQSMSL